MPLWRSKLVAAKLRNHEVIAYPTEGVWGLGCIPESMEAVSRILAMKGRSWEQGLILVASTMEQVAPYLEGVNADEMKVLASVWPAPVTFLVPDCGAAPEWIRGRHSTVALRVSAHPVIQSICAALGHAIVSTSANPSGRRPAHDQLRLRQYFPHGIDYIVPGELGGNAGASEIRILRTGEVVRPAVAQSK